MPTKTKNAPKKSEKFQEENDKDNETETLQEEDEISRKIAQVIADFQKKLPDIVRQILEDMVPPMARTEEGELPVEPPMLKDKTTKTKEDPNKELLEMMSELKGEIAGLKEQDRQRNEAAKARDRADASIKTLTDEGWHLTDDVQKAIRDISEESETALEKYLTGYKNTVPKDPPKSLESLEVFTEDPPELQKYKLQSPEVLEAARRLSRQFDELKAEKADLHSSREEFIDINMEVTAT